MKKFQFLSLLRSLIFGSIIHSTTLCQLDANPIREIVRNFETRAPDTNALVQGRDGYLYGTTARGGDSGNGTAFKVSYTGEFTTLVSFNGTNGKSPLARLIQGIDGNFYGTTSEGGKYGNGTVFKMKTNGEINTLMEFDGQNGKSPSAALVQANDGNYYGTTSKGGSNDKGTVFRITNSGLLTTLVNFDSSNGQFPVSSLLQANDGNFYGTTFGYIDRINNSNNDSGTLFKMSPQGTLVTLINFDDGEHNNPTADLIQGQDGNLYVGTCRNVIKVTTDGLPIRTSYVGNAGVSTIIEDNDGSIYCISTTVNGGNHGTVSLTKTIAKLSISGIVTNFCSLTSRDGNLSLIKANDGNFYGTESWAKSCEIFKVDSAGKLSVIYGFPMDPLSPGFLRLLTQDGKGDLYGVAFGAGLENHRVIFKVTPSGAISNFAELRDERDGVPLTLFKSRDGNFYGSTLAENSDQDNIIFKLSPRGNFTTLFNFHHGRVTLMQGRDGSFYGTTEYKGNKNKGSVFKITSSGKFKTLVTFDGENGRSPTSTLIEDYFGDFYGTTMFGGSRDYGTIFKMTASGKLTTLVDFDFNRGANPKAGLTQSSDGNLYGYTSWAQDESGYFYSNCFFKINHSGKLKSLIQLPGHDDQISGALIQGRDGNFYGTTILGYRSQGTLFQLTPAGRRLDLDYYTLFHYPPESLLSGIDGNIYASIVLEPTTTGQWKYSSGEISRLRFMFPDINVTDQSKKPLIDNISTVNYGKIKRSNPNATRVFRVKNKGSSTLKDLMITQNGLHPSDFKVSALAGAALEPGSTMTFQVTFKPKAKGLRRASIHIKSNDPDESSFDIKLIGESSF
jgi:uncharacterized repeat protein (TIGR03803 family)